MPKKKHMPKAIQRALSKRDPRRSAEKEAKTLEHRQHRIKELNTKLQHASERLLKNKDDHHAYQTYRRTAAELDAMGVEV